MNISDFDYHLPRELIAQYPLPERDAARLLVLNRKQETIEHRVFKDCIDYFSAADLLVLNNTKVLCCRLKGRRISGGKVEVLLLNQKNDAHKIIFNALLRPGRLRLNERIVLGDGNGTSINCLVTGKSEVTFPDADPGAIYKIGRIPLPPYIKREPEELDSEYYQTVYAACEGSVASPTAGLHFSEELLSRIRAHGIHTAYITLHVGHATFKPIQTADITKHTMEKERFFVNDSAAAIIENTRRQKGRICAVGTTSCRTLETWATGKKEGETDLFIYPGVTFRLTDCLLTNFHLPRTTLYALVCAFAGVSLIRKAYQEAVEQKYRFYSYGDAMLIL